MTCDLGLQPGLCIGPLPIRFYGMIIVLGIMVGGFVASREARRRGENPDRIWDALVWVAIAGILGARLYHVISSPRGSTIGFDYYMANPMEILNFRQGGLGHAGRARRTAVQHAASSPVECLIGQHPADFRGNRLGLVEGVGPQVEDDRLFLIQGLPRPAAIILAVVIAVPEGASSFFS